MSATVTGTNSPAQTVTWTTSNTNVATVSSSGVVTAVAKGTATITATSTVDDTKSGSCAVTVVRTTSGNGHWETSTTAYRKALFGSSYNSAGVNTYSASWSATNTDNATSTSFTVDLINASNYNNNWAYVKIGHKTTAYTGTITTSAAIDQPIGKVTLKIGALANAAQVTSVKLLYDDDATFASPEELSFTIATGDQDVTIAEPEANLYYRIEVVCTTGDKNGPIQINGIDYFNSTYIQEGAATVTSVEVSPSSLNFDLNGTHTATLSAIVTGENDPVTTVTWSSSNSNIATVTTSGVVTGVGTGTVIITATSTADVTKSGTCEIVIIDSSASVSGVSFTQGSPYMNGVAYKMFFYNTQTLNSYYFSGAKSGNYGATTTAINNATDVFFEANGTTGQNIYFMKDGTKNYFSVIQSTSGSNTYYNFNYSADTPTIPWYYQESGNDYACMTYTFNNTLYTFGTYSTYTTIGTVNLGTYTSNYEIEFVTKDTSAPTAFSQLFLSSLTCNAQGTSAPTFATGISWEQFAKAYSKIDASLQSVIENATANENGTIIEQAVARYDYILNKYGVDNYFNFLSRDVGNSSKILGKAIVSNDAILILIIMSVLGTFTFAAWFIHKKKQYDLQ